MHTNPINQRAASGCHLEQKEFATMRAQAAIRGYVLHRSESTDGPVVYFVERHGQLHYKPSMAALRAFLAPMQIMKEAADQRQPSGKVGML